MAQPLQAHNHGDRHIVLILNYSYNVECGQERRRAALVPAATAGKRESQISSKAVTIAAWCWREFRDRKHRSSCSKPPASKISFSTTISAIDRRKSSLGSSDSFTTAKLSLTAGAAHGISLFTSAAPSGDGQLLLPSPRMTLFRRRRRRRRSTVSEGSTSVVDINVSVSSSLLNHPLSSSAEE